MQRFDVQNRNQNVRSNYLLEASAGTGKTFAIENIVVRLLLDDSSIDIKQILVVTFTRAATSDLKKRIRSNIEKALLSLKTKDPQSPDYLLKHIEQGDEEIDRARRSLELALYSFDQAQIFTIHGFCSRMLRDHLFEGNLSLNLSESDEQFGDIQILKIIRDYFRTELRPNHYSQEQLKIILNYFSGSTEKLERELLKIVKRGMDIVPLPDFSYQFDAFVSIMQKFQSLQYGSKNILKDILLQAPAYKKACDKNRKIKPEFLSKAEVFAKLFQKTEWPVSDFEALIGDPNSIIEIFDPENRRNDVKAPLSSDLTYPDFIPQIRKELAPLVKSTGHPLMILGRMVQGCRQMLKTYLQTEEKLNYDDFLQAMRQAIKNPLFATKIQDNYKAAIVDEFQDTDPLQWQIFRDLFIDSTRYKGSLYLVGDPKQSIYAFRQADIYTYLSAADALGSSRHASLDTNYRSQPSLVTALNSLFTSAPNMLSLPRLGTALTYPEVKSSSSIASKQFSDPYGDVHFCIAKNPNPDETFSLDTCENSYFFPYFVEELLKLNTIENIGFNQCAMLVSDRYQAQRLAEYLNAHNIPAVTQRTTSLSDSPALHALYEIIHSVLYCKQLSIAKVGLGGQIIGLTHDQIRALDDPNFMEGPLAKLNLLRGCLYNQGFSVFFNELMQSSWNQSSQSVSERLLSQNNGLEFYEDLHQIAQIVLENEHSANASPERLLEFLDQLSTLDTSDDERLKKRTNLTQKAVHILTLHASKGLEFDIVFALGLVSRSKPPEELIPILGQLEDSPMLLSPTLDQASEEYKNYCKEIDAEKMRQLYVAMTRAKFRLYIPVMINPNNAAPKPGCASPIELFLTRLGTSQIDIESLQNLIATYDGNQLIDFIKKQEPDTKISYVNLIAKTLEPSLKDKADSPMLTAPPMVNVPSASECMYSFTTLSSNKASKSTVEAPYNYQETNKTIHNLPSNSTTGNLLHKILESIPFSEISQHNDSHDVIHLIKPFLQGTQFDCWDQVISEMIFHTSRTALPLGNGSLLLHDIHQNQMFKEIEFLYPCQGISFVEDLECGPGYLKGIIDLIFCYEDKYYIIDWKSNWLGPNASDYNYDNMHKAMVDHDYFLQAKIYIGALERYLKVVDDRPFNEIFGGVFYLFLRGLGGLPGSTNGVYFVCEKQDN